MSIHHYTLWSTFSTYGERRIHFRLDTDTNLGGVTMIGADGKPYEAGFKTEGGDHWRYGELYPVSMLRALWKEACASGGWTRGR
jgi:hypothetical protein